MAGLSMASSEQASSASRAWAMKASISIPVSAAGTNPNTERAEKRPPTVGSPENTARQPSLRAWRSRSLPGSVMATRCFTTCSPSSFSKEARTASSSMRGSMVPPLFEEMMTSVR